MVESNVYARTCGSALMVTLLHEIEMRKSCTIGRVVLYFMPSSEQS